MINDKTISITVDAEPQELADLNAHLVEKGVRVVEFYEEKTNLEDLFMKISSGKADISNEVTQ